MKVAMLVPAAHESTGITSYAGNLCDSLKRNGVQIDTPPINQATGASRDSLKSFAHEYDWSQFDIIHAELGGGRVNEFVLLEQLFAMGLPTPITATIHDPERIIWKPEKLPLSLEKTLKNSPFLLKAAVIASDPLTLSRERALARRSSRLICLTDTGRRHLTQRMKADEGKVVVIPHGVLSFEPVDLPTQPALRVIYFGYIYRGKGIEDLLQAMARLFAKEPNHRKKIRLTIAGGSNPDTAFKGSGQYLNELKSLIESLELSDCVDLQTDVPEADLIKVIQAHDLMVLPYRSSKKLKILGHQVGTSGALAWALAAGRGAIASDARAFKEELSLGNGTTYPEGDIDALARELESAIKAPQKVLDWSKNAARIAGKRSWEITGGKYLSIWHELLNETP